MAWLLLPVMRSLARGRAPQSPLCRQRAFWETGSLVLVLLILAAAGLVAVPAVFRCVTFVREHQNLFGQWIGQVIHSAALLAASGLAPFVFGLLAARLKAGHAKTVMTFFFSLSGPLFYGVVFLVVGSRLLDVPDLSRAAAAAAVAIGAVNLVSAISAAGTFGAISVANAFSVVYVGYVAFVNGALTLWGWLLVDINEFSPHAYYRNWLCKRYLAARRVDQTGIVRRFSNASSMDSGPPKLTWKPGWANSRNCRSRA